MDETIETDVEYAPRVLFDVSSEEDGERAFVRGYEAGRLDCRLAAKPESWAGTYHTTNREMLERIAKANGYLVTIEQSTDPTWIYATFQPKPKLRLVGLAQHRQRYLLVARHAPTCAPLLYQPPKKRVRGVGEVLGELPMPATVAARAWGSLHLMPKLSWRNWLRLALIPAGGDWRDLDGVLEGRARREVFRRHAVQAWGEPIDAVTGPGGHSVEAVSDPRVPDGTAWHRDGYGVRPWDEASGAVTGGADNPSRGRFSVADPRADAIRVPVGYDAAYGVLRWNEPARTVAGNSAAGCGAYAVADPRSRELVEDVRVLTLDEAMALDLDPRKPPPFTPLIVSEDGTWHRPMTLLELAALQGIPSMVDGAPLRLEGTRTQIATHIGNAVPVGAGEAIGMRVLSTLAGNDASSWSMESGSVWVLPEERTVQA